MGGVRGVVRERRPCRVRRRGLRARARPRIAVAAVAVLAVSAAGFGLSAIDPDRVTTLRVGGAGEGHVLSVHIQRPNVQSRLAAWKTGLEGFAARPLLGWGAGQLHSGLRPLCLGIRRHHPASRPGAQQARRGRRHHRRPGSGSLAGAVGGGVSGAVAGRPGLEARERVLVVFVGAALFGGLVQAQFQFDTAVGSLQTILLLGFVASLEAAAVPDAFRPRLPVRLSAACRALPRHGWLRVAAGRGRPRPSGGRPHRESGRVRRRGRAAPERRAMARARVAEGHVRRHRRFQAPCELLPVGPVQRTCRALAADTGQERYARAGTARMGGAGGGGGRSHGTPELANPAEPGLDVSRGGGDRPRVRHAGAALSGARAGACAQPAGVSRRSAPAGRPRGPPARRRPPRVALAVG